VIPLLSPANEVVRQRRLRLSIGHGDELEHAVHSLSHRRLDALGVDSELVITPSEGPGLISEPHPALVGDFEQMLALRTLHPQGSALRPLLLEAPFAHASSSPLSLEACQATGHAQEGRRLLGTPLSRHIHIPLLIQSDWHSAFGPPKQERDPPPQLSRGVDGRL